MNPWSLDWKQQKLEDLRERWKSCERCLLADCRTNVVFGVGDAGSPVMLIGEAPGEQEDQDGKPFVGDSGKLLRAMLDNLGSCPEDFYITNTVLCRPPDNRDPTKDELRACYHRLRDEIYIIDPLLIIAVGKVAFQVLTKCKDSMESGHGELFPVTIPGNSTFGGEPTPVQYDVMPVYHPAFILRADSIDPKTKQWSKGGPANKTLKDLETAIHLVNLLKEKYNAIEVELRRNSHGHIVHPET